MKKSKTITREQALKSANDGKNQDIKSKFIEREVFCNVNSLVEFILSNEGKDAPFTLDDVENLYTPDNEKALDDLLELWNDQQSEMKEYSNDPDTFNRKVKTESDFRVFLNSLDDDELKETFEHFDIDVETEPQEVFEWWAVSGYLFDKLKDQGCVVVDSGSCKVWGRCTTGQAILLDGVISRICADMGILEGQENAWL